VAQQFSAKQSEHDKTEKCLYCFISTSISFLHILILFFLILLFLLIHPIRTPLLSGSQKVNFSGGQQDMHA
jgi:hypothetical protein